MWVFNAIQFDDTGQKGQQGQIIYPGESELAGEDVVAGVALWSSLNNFPAAGHFPFDFRTLFPLYSEIK